jgi:transposase
VEFTTMRHFAMRFRGLLRGGTVEKLDAWLQDARGSGIYGMRRFARALRHEIEAVRNAVPEPWSNAQTEGQINRLKTLKRTMYDRAGVDLLRARLGSIEVAIGRARVRVEGAVDPEALRQMLGLIGSGR